MLQLHVVANIGGQSLASLRPRCWDKSIQPAGATSPLPPSCMLMCAGGGWMSRNVRAAAGIHGNETRGNSEGRLDPRLDVAGREAVASNLTFHSVRYELN